MPQSVYPVFATYVEIWVVIDEVDADGWMMNKEVMSEKSSKEIYGKE
jgi:phenylpyruvate tautomerase PptA (4-oxalocrotonate tautomerase family)